MKKFKSFAACLCAMACIASSLTPATVGNAATVEKAATSENTVLTDNSTVLDDLLDTNKQSISACVVSQTDPTTPVQVPVSVTVSDFSNEDKMWGETGALTASQSVSYEFKVSSDSLFYMGARLMTDDGSNVSANFVLTDASGSQILSTSASSASTEDAFAECNITAGKVYTLTVTAGYDLTNAQYAFVASAIDNSKSRSISAGKEYLACSSTKKSVYRKIKITKNQRIIVTRQDIGSSYSYGGYVTLCDSKKKVISRKSYTLSDNNYTTTFAVKKGTYYIRLDDVSSYFTVYKVTKSTSGSIASTKKSKGTKITSKKKNYILPAKSKKATYWFKITLPKAKKMTFTMTYLGTNQATVTIYHGNQNKYNRTYSNGDQGTVTYKNYLTGAKTAWPKGTYYVKITNPAKESGIFSIKAK